MINKHPDKMTYWRLGAVDYMGQPSWDGPYTSTCRWEDEQRLYLTSDGTEARGRSMVFSDDGSLEIGDRVYQGVSSDSEPPQDSFDVKQPRRIKNLRGTRVENRYIL